MDSHDSSMMSLETATLIHHLQGERAKLCVTFMLPAAARVPNQWDGCRVSGTAAPFDTGDVSLNVSPDCPWISSQQHSVNSTNGVTAVLNSPTAPHLAGEREHKLFVYKDLG